MKNAQVGAVSYMSSSADCKRGRDDLYGEINVSETLRSLENWSYWSVLQPNISSPSGSKPDSESDEWRFGSQQTGTRVLNKGKDIKGGFMKISKCCFFHMEKSCVPGWFSFSRSARSIDIQGGDTDGCLMPVFHPQSPTRYLCVFIIEYSKYITYCCLSLRLEPPFHQAVQFGAAHLGTVSSLQVGISWWAW